MMSGSDTYSVERQRYFDAPPAAVLERIVDLRGWQAWSPWEDLDPDLERTYGGADVGVGAWYAWDGNRKAGKGRMEIVGVTASTVAIDLQFIKPFKSRSTTEFILRPEGGGTRVTWRVTGPKTFMIRAMGIFTSMDKVLGPDFEKGLERLEADVETGDGDEPTTR